MGISMKTRILSHLSKVPTSLEELQKGLEMMDEEYIALGTEYPLLPKWLFENKQEDLYPESEQFKNTYNKLFQWTTNSEKIIDYTLSEIEEALQYAFFVNYRTPRIIKEYLLFTAPYTTDFCI